MGKAEPLMKPASYFAKKLSKAKGNSWDKMKGINKPNLPEGTVDKNHISQAGTQVRIGNSHTAPMKKSFMRDAKAHHKNTLAEMKAIPKPNLPKSEMTKEEKRPAGTVSAKEHSKNWNKHQKRMKTDKKYREHVEAVEADQFKSSVETKSIKGKKDGKK